MAIPFAYAMYAVARFHAIGKHLRINLLPTHFKLGKNQPCESLENSVIFRNKGPITVEDGYNCVLSAPEIAQLFAGVKAFWKFDEGSGTTARDSSGNVNDGLLRNGAGWTGSGIEGNALSLNGLNGYVEVASTEALKYRGGDMTLSAWIKLNASETDGGWIISKPWNGGGQYNYCLYRTSGGRIIFRLDGSTAVELATDTTVSAGAWHHIAATVNSAGEMRIYIDGVENKAGVHSITDWTPSKGDRNLPLAIGTQYPYGQGWSGSTPHSFDGMIDETTIYNRALPASEIQRLFNY